MIGLAPWAPMALLAPADVRGRCGDKAMMMMMMMMMMMISYVLWIVFEVLNVEKPIYLTLDFHQSLPLLFPPDDGKVVYVQTDVELRHAERRAGDQNSRKSISTHAEEKASATCLRPSPLSHSPSSYVNPCGTWLESWSLLQA